MSKTLDELMALAQAWALEKVDREDLASTLRELIADAEREWKAMLYAPLDGTKVQLLIRHRDWWTARKSNPRKADESWEQIVEGHWIDHNGGGWTWQGMAGTPIGWKPISARKG